MMEHEICQNIQLSNNVTIFLPDRAISSKQMNKTRAVICGYYGQGNAGDEALLMSLLQMLPEHIKTDRTFW